MKISRRNFLKVLGSTTMAGALAACGGSSSTSAAVSGAASTAATAAPGTTYTMNIGSVMSASHPSIVALQSFEKAVEERTNGGIQVEIYTDSALGGESDLIEQVRGGSTEACMQMGAANFEGINAEVNVALLPFLFTSLDNARNAWGGDFGAQFAEKLIEPMGFKVLSIWESGYRHMTNNTRPLEKPEDLKGIKFRTNENSMKVAMYDALDASIVIMAFSDVYTGLQNGTIDAQENAADTCMTSNFQEVQKYLNFTNLILYLNQNIYSSSLQDVQKYLSLNGHMYDAAPFVCNMDWFNSLPTEYQEILMEEAKNAREIDLEENDENKYLDLLKEAGMEVNEVDKAAFQAKMDGVWADYASQYADGQSWIDLATSFNK